MIIKVVLKEADFLGGGGAKIVQKILFTSLINSSVQSFLIIYRLVIFLGTVSNYAYTIYRIIKEISFFFLHVEKDYRNTKKKSFCQTDLFVLRTADLNHFYNGFLFEFLYNFNQLMVSENQ